MPVEPFMHVLTHKSCEIQSTLESISEIKIVITFMDLERYSLLCVSVKRTLCVFLVIYDL